MTRAEAHEHFINTLKTLPLDAIQTEALRRAAVAYAHAAAMEAVETVKEAIGRYAS